MIEVSIKKLNGKPELLKPASYQIGGISFRVYDNGSTQVTAPISMAERLKTNDEKVVEVQTTDKSEPVTLRFFDTTPASYLSKEQVAIIEAEKAKIKNII